MSRKLSSHCFSLCLLPQIHLKIRQEIQTEQINSLDRFRVPHFLFDSCNLSNKFNHLLLKQAELLLLAFNTEATRLCLICQLPYCTGKCLHYTKNHNV